MLIVRKRLGQLQRLHRAILQITLRNAKALEWLLKAQPPLCHCSSAVARCPRLPAPQDMLHELSSNSRCRAPRRNKPRTDHPPEQMGIFNALINRDGSVIDTALRGTIGIQVAKARPLKPQPKTIGNGCSRRRTVSSRSSRRRTSRTSRRFSVTKSVSASSGDLLPFEFERFCRTGPTGMIGNLRRGRFSIERAKPILKSKEVCHRHGSPWRES